MKDDVLDNVKASVPTAWINSLPQRSALTPHADTLLLTEAHLHESERRWQLLGPLIKALFPHEAPEGIIESGLVPLPGVRPDTAGLLLPEAAQPPLLLLKCDNNLPVCGSVKARGGFYEVLTHAEDLARKHGWLQPSEDTTGLLRAEVQQQLSTHRVVVGSTGNLGLSVGMAAAAVGFLAEVHMSADAKEWKKQLLRQRGVIVVEHAGDYNEAVAAGRAQALADPQAHFVDDERSTALFLGYSTAALRLQAQLQALGVEPSGARPLVVHIPCGVGGAPGGICWGLHHVYGPHVHVFYAEPTHAPCCLLGLATGQGADISVQDVGLDGCTVADGLAVARMSALCFNMTRHLVAGCYTASDEEMLAGVALLHQEQGHFVEPSCAAALLGVRRLTEWLQQQHDQEQQKQQSREQGRQQGAGEGVEHVRHLLRAGVHVFWATGGSLVDQELRGQILAEGRAHLQAWQQARAG